MEIKKFDYYWRIALIVALILGMIWTVVEFRQISRAGLECASQPFLYGAKVMSEKYGEKGHFECSVCSVGNDEVQKSYSFNQDEENFIKNQDFGGLNLNFNNAG